MKHALSAFAISLSFNALAFDVITSKENGTSIRAVVNESKEVVIKTCEGFDINCENPREINLGQREEFIQNSIRRLALSGQLKKLSDGDWSDLWPLLKNGDYRIMKTEELVSNLRIQEKKARKRFNDEKNKLKEKYSKAVEFFKATAGETEQDKPNNRQIDDFSLAVDSILDPSKKNDVMNNLLEAGALDELIASHDELDSITTDLVKAYKKIAKEKANTQRLEETYPKDQQQMKLFIKAVDELYGLIERDKLSNANMLNEELRDLANGLLRSYSEMEDLSELYSAENGIGRCQVEEIDGSMVFFDRFALLYSPDHRTPGEFVIDAQKDYHQMGVTWNTVSGLIVDNADSNGYSAIKRGSVKGLEVNDEIVNFGKLISDTFYENRNRVFDFYGLTVMFSNPFTGGEELAVHERDSDIYEVYSKFPDRDINQVGLIETFNIEKSRLKSNNPIKTVAMDPICRSIYEGLVTREEIKQVLLDKKRVDAGSIQKVKGQGATLR